MQLTQYQIKHDIYIYFYNRENQAQENIPRY